MLSFARVLLVDDDAQVRQTTAAQLRVLGCEVTAADSSWAALKALSTSAFDLLLTDVVLPDGPDGLELARRARRAFPSDLHIVLTSGHAQSTLAEVLGHKPPFPILRKPYRLQDLQQVLEQARAHDERGGMVGALMSRRMET